jgi:dTDP-6-deoxy-L-talose 4-dehydrogenase (NAD+)
MRILVTGATGFIGRHVVDYLISLGGHELITTSIKSKEEAEAVFSSIKKTDYIPKDLNQKEENYYSFFGNPDCIIHLSWEGLPNYNELFHIERNLPANFYFIKNMIQNGLNNITITGTCFEYGLQNGCLSEDMDTAPVTYYGLAKDTLRKCIELLHNTYAFNMKWVRIFYPYGHGQSKKSLYSLMEDAISNNAEQFNMSQGEQLRDYISIDRVAEYISKTALQNDITGVINCCSGKPVSVRKFVEDFFKERGVTMKLNFGCYPYPQFEPLGFWGEVEKISNIISPPPPPP